jgi:hypothetical protein
MANCGSGGALKLRSIGPFAFGMMLADFTEKPRPGRKAQSKANSQPALGEKQTSSHPQAFRPSAHTYASAPPRSHTTLSSLEHT